MDWWIKRKRKMVLKLNCYNQGLDKYGLETKMHYKRFEMGCYSSCWRIQKESLLCLVWCSNRLHFNHSKLVGRRLWKMVEGKQCKSLSVYGKRQHSFPHCDFPFKFDRLRNGLDFTSSYFYNRILELRIRKILKKKRNWSFRWCCCNNRNSLLSLEILLVNQQTWEIRLRIQLERVRRKKQ